MENRGSIADIRDRYRNAKIFIERGYSHKDTAKIEYDYPQMTHNQASRVTDDMYEIYKVAIQIQLFDITNEIYWYNANVPKDETKSGLGVIRSHIYNLSQLLFREGRSLRSELGSVGLDEATEIATRIAINESED